MQIQQRVKQSSKIVTFQCVSVGRIVNEELSISVTLFCMTRLQPEGLLLYHKPLLPQLYRYCAMQIVNFLVNVVLVSLKLSSILLQGIYHWIMYGSDTKLSFLFATQIYLRLLFLALNMGLAWKTKTRLSYGRLRYDESQSIMHSVLVKMSVLVLFVF
jgi:hypothetical protein